MTPEEMNDWNEQIKAEFRANAGVVGGPFEGMPLLILHTIGAKSGPSMVSKLGTATRTGRGSQGRANRLSPCWPRASPVPARPS